MNTPALPAYLQNRQSQGVAARATTGMGGVLPPHISRAGNSFTLIDSAGNKMPLGPVMTACAIDICDVMQKVYYETDWMQGSDQPPDCYSRNGITPSQDAQHKQSPTCGQCEWNVRGSNTSKISGKAIKACRDQKETALLLPQYPQMLFQLVIPPGSFKNWAAFSEPFKKGGTDISDVLIEFAFEAGSNGVMTFRAISYIDEAVFGAREQALASKATDALVGRNDVPIAITHQPAQVQQPAPLIAAPAAAVTTAQPAFAGSSAPAGNAGFGGQPQAQVPFGAGAPASSAAAFGQPGSTPVPSAATRSPSEPARRHRRTRAEIAADNAAAAAAQAGSGASPQPSASVQPSPPFPTQQQPGGFGGASAQAPFGAQSAAPTAQPQTGATFAGPAPTGSNGTFGIQPGADPNVDPQLAEMLRSIGQ